MYMRKFKDHERTVEKEAKVSEMIESAESRALVLANRLQLEKERRGACGFRIWIIKNKYLSEDRAGKTDNAL